MARSSEVYKVDIRAASPAFLPTLAWNGATKRNRPVLETLGVLSATYLATKTVRIGTLVHARVEAAHPDLDTELSCTDPDTKKPLALKQRKGYDIVRDIN